MTGHIGVSLYSRIFLLLCGLALSAWTFNKLRDRHLFVSATAFFVFLGISLILFAAFPMPFDEVSFLFLGIHYPPVLYLIVAVLALMAVVIHLAAQLVDVEKRCVRLLQEVAIQTARLDSLARARGANWNDDSAADAPREAVSRRTR